MAPDRRLGFSLVRAVLAAVAAAAALAPAAGQTCTPLKTFPLPKGGVGTPVLAVGDEVSCILRDGGVLCFGRGSDGSQGLGDEMERGQTQFLSELFAPGFKLPLPADVAQVDVGYRSPCVLFVDGKVMCWVRNRGASHVAGTCDDVAARVSCESGRLAQPITNRRSAPAHRLPPRITPMRRVPVLMVSWGTGPPGPAATSATRAVRTPRPAAL